MTPFGKNKRWAHGWPHAMKAFRLCFFPFAGVHHVGLAYILSDLRTCTQRMFARNISEAGNDPAVAAPSQPVLPRCQSLQPRGGQGSVTTSPRMPHTIAEIFTHVHLLDLKSCNSWAWAGSGQRVRHVTSAASGALSQRPALSQAAAETSGKEESCSTSSSLQRGWSARMAARWSSHRPACSIRYRSPHVSSSASDSFKTITGARSRRLHHSHFSHGRQNRRSSFCSGRGENLVTIVRFGKPLFANMRHRVHAVAWPLRKPTVACPHPDVSTGWPVMWSTLSSHSADASVLTFCRPNGFFFAFAPTSSPKT